MLTCHLQMKMKSKTECPFLMWRLFVKIKHLPFLFIVNLSLVGFIYILRAFYQLPIRFPKILLPVSCTLQWVLLWWMCWYLNVRIGGHTGISPLTKKRDKPMNSSAADHLLFCNHSASYDDFDILTH